MNSLESQYLSIKSVNGRKLECLNNFGETVRVGISSEESPLSEVGLTSLNSIIEAHSTSLSNFGDYLPQTYNIGNGVILNKPGWLDFKTNRSRPCGFAENGDLELPTSVSCKLK